MRDKPKPGRRPRIGAGERGAIVKMALESPRLFGYLRNEWSLRLLSMHLTFKLGEIRLN